MSSIFKFVCVLMLAWSGAANADLLDALKQLNQTLSSGGAALGLKPVNGATGQGGANLPAMATPSADPNQPDTQLIVPSEPRVKTSMDEALPIVKKVLAIHQCIKDGGMQQLNFLAVPGVDFTPQWGMNGSWPNSSLYMRYHDRNKCLSIRQIDNWEMPALNALTFRAIYFSIDSGETVSFSYLMKRVDDGSWKLAQIQRI